MNWYWGVYFIWRFDVVKGGVEKKNLTKRLIRWMNCRKRQEQEAWPTPTRTYGSHLSAHWGRLPWYLWAASLRRGERKGNASATPLIFRSNGNWRECGQNTTRKRIVGALVGRRSLWKGGGETSDYQEGGRRNGASMKTGWRRGTSTRLLGEGNIQGRRKERIVGASTRTTWSIWRSQHERRKRKSHREVS